MLKRILCLILALMMPTGVLATEWDTWAADITGEITAWNAFDDATLDVLKDWAKNAELTLTVGVDAADSVLKLNGRTVLGLHDSEKGMGIFPGGLLITGSAEEKQRILGTPPEWLNYFQMLPAGATAAAYMAKAVPLILAPYAHEEKVSVNVKNVGNAASRVTYELEKDDWAILWPQIAEEAVKALKRNGADEELVRQAKPLLSSLQFEKKGTLKRFINKDGQDISWSLPAPCPETVRTRERSA